MISRIKAMASGAVLVGALDVSSLVAGTPALAAQRDAGSQLPRATAGSWASLSLVADKPIIHLGEAVTLTGTHYTPGARVTVYLHGPFADTPGLGSVYGHAVVSRQGNWTMKVLIARYPDKQARINQEVIAAVSSTARYHGMVDGGAAFIQVNPVPSIDITTHGGLTWTSLVVDGTAVKAEVAPRDATHYTVSYAGHLRVGLYSAYLKWGDASGAYGAKAWSFRVGSPWMVPADPRLSAKSARVRLGHSVLLWGRGFTPSVSVDVTVSGPFGGAGSGTPIRAVADGWGYFTIRVPVAGYPDTYARQNGIVYINASAHGAQIGDLPEAVATPVQIVS